MQELDYSHIYRKWHSDDPDHIEKEKKYLKRTLAQFLPENRKAKILDIGCGMGFALLMLVDLEYENLSGIDSDKQQVRSCRDKNLAVDQVADAANYLQQRPEEFDLILALDMIEHIPVTQQLPFIRAVQKSLKSGGRLIATVPNASSTLVGRWRYNDWTHTSSFTEHSLDFLLHNGGLTEIEIHQAGSFQRPRLPWLLRPAVLRWLLLVFVRSFRRLEMITELGWKEGRAVPLSLNLLSVAKKPNG